MAINGIVDILMQLKLYSRTLVCVCVCVCVCVDGAGDPRDLKRSVSLLDSVSVSSAWYGTTTSNSSSSQAHPVAFG